MKNNFLQEIVVSAILIVLLLLFINPFGFWMPTVLLMTMMLGLVVMFTLFASLIWKENHRDEREGIHKMIAGRIAFLVGASLLVIGIVTQSFRHELDFWLVFTLGGMMLAKIIALIYTRIKY